MFSIIETVEYNELWQREHCVPFPVAVKLFNHPCDIHYEFLPFTRQKFPLIIVHFKSPFIFLILEAPISTFS